MAPDLCASLSNFWHKPNKPWFKLGKLVLTLMRSILFVIFIILLIFSRVLSPSKSVPLLCLYLILIYNWRFLLSLVILCVLVLLKLTKGCCGCCMSETFYTECQKRLHKALLSLFWKAIDWGCFLSLKYYLYIFDIVHYFAYLVSAVVIGTLQILNKDLYDAPIIVFFVNVPLFLMHIFIEIYRIVQAQRVQACIRDIFGSDVKFSSKARLMISEDQLGSMSCAEIFASCSIVDAEHRAFSHPKEIFKIKFSNVEFKQMGVNICIGFHQTTIDAAKSILTTSFKASESGMIGPGIYFANNYDITEHKRNQSTEGGAIFCARIDLGKVYEISSKDDQRNLSKSYNSKYLHHIGGEKYDEFVVYSHEQILDYVIIVENEAIQNYRKTVTKPYCNCINFI